MCGFFEQLKAHLFSTCVDRRLSRLGQQPRDFTEQPIACRQDELRYRALLQLKWSEAVLDPERPLAPQTMGPYNDHDP